MATFIKITLDFSREGGSIHEHWIEHSKAWTWYKEFGEFCRVHIDRTRPRFRDLPPDCDEDYCHHTGEWAPDYKFIPFLDDSPPEPGQKIN